MTHSAAPERYDRTDAEKVADRDHCPDGRLRCLDCREPLTRRCAGRQFGCGQDDYQRIRIVELEQRAEKAEQALSLAQTEIKGHMRVVDDLRAELKIQDDANELLQRDLSVAQEELRQAKALMQPGQIDAVMQGIRQRDEQLAQAQARIAELEKDAARGRYLLAVPHERLYDDRALKWSPEQAKAAIDAEIEDRA